MPRRACVALACALAACSRQGPNRDAPDRAPSPTMSALPPGLATRQLPALLPVRQPDGRPFEGAIERLGHDTYDLECDGGPRRVTCAQFLGGRGAACPPSGTPAAVAWTNADLDCRALDLVSRGAPATVSYLRTFSMRADHAAELPAVLWRASDADAGAHSGPSLRAAVPDVRQVVATPSRAKYESSDAWLELVVFAFGDFGSPAPSAGAGAGPADGVDDVIVQARGGPKAGSAFRAQLWVLTRRSAAGPLEIVQGT